MAGWGIKIPALGIKAEVPQIAKDVVKAGGLGLPGMMAIAQKEKEHAAGQAGPAADPLGPPEWAKTYGSQWEGMAKNLSEQQRQQALSQAQAGTQSAYAGAAQNLAMKGGINASARERMASDQARALIGQQGNIQSAYDQARTGIQKSALEQAQDYELKRMQGAQQASAYERAAEASKPKGFLGQAFSTIFG